MPRQFDLTPEEAISLIHHLTPGLRMVRHLGNGSFGQVFLLEDDWNRVAVKIVLLPDDPDENQEWHQLTHNWDRLNHASLVRVRQFFQHGKYGLIYMDYWPMDLYDCVKRLVKEGLHTPERKRTLLIHLARLLHRLHADTGLIVTDLKLENVMVASRGEGSLALALIDLGGVCEARLADLYRVITTDFYMAPEIHDKSLTIIDEPVLIFSFGLIGFFILEGRWPVDAYDYLQPILGPLREQGGARWTEANRVDMPGCVAIIERCLAESRQERFATLEELIQALQEEAMAYRRHRNALSWTPPPTRPVKGPRPTTWREPLTDMTFVRVPAGHFLMGQSPEENALLTQLNDQPTFQRWYGRELPRRRVALDSFWIGRFPVTRGQFALFVAETLYQTDMERRQFAVRANARLKKSVGWTCWSKTRFPQEESHPAVHISWFDAKAFLAWLTERTGLPFVLPSEAQWEYACHGGGSAPYHFGKTITTDLANFDGSEPFGPCPSGVYRKGTTPSGMFPANHYGLHDMHGNVWEWCEDLYSENFYQTHAEARKNPVNQGAIGYRIKRGGSWRSPPALVRAAYRGGSYPDIGKDDIGFRVVLLAD
ncbi:MAG: SUMF1/EgtB/PvdO family nonheme iron enzyme [Magnetococcales bacterium]|nr:SUMF1/EgtB/PvdO family nonheme iron enzyme [Magnetococcales bacterium]